MNHKHNLKEIQFGVNEKADFIQFYLCTDCDIRSDVPFPTEEVIADHLKHDSYIDGCFGCKIRTLELGAGDAARAEHMSAKKWDGELEAYRKARSEGIQPAGTTMKAINEAKSASDKLGTAFNAESMPAASSITKQSAKVMKETGVA